MRTAIVAATLAVFAGHAVAQGGAPDAELQAACVDVRIGDARSYDCINRILQRSVPPRAYAVPSVPLSAASQSNEVGTFNLQATRQLLGNSFGTSVIPQRPPPEGGVSPLAANIAVPRPPTIGRSLTSFVPLAAARPIVPFRPPTTATPRIFPPLYTRRP